MKLRIGILLGALLTVVLISTAFSGSGDDADTTKTAEQVEKEDHAQSTNGIQFEHISFEEAKQKAAITGKPIFIDCYTDWCGPCKRMAATTFQEEEVANFFNKNFINLKVEMEKEEDGVELARLYKVRAYPTLLFVDGNGKLLNQMIGMQNSNQLLTAAKSIVK